jgi:hypothetical protein
VNEHNIHTYAHSLLSLFSLSLSLSLSLPHLEAILLPVTPTDVPIPTDHTGPATKKEEEIMTKKEYI